MQTCRKDVQCIYEFYSNHMSNFNMTASRFNDKENLRCFRCFLLFYLRREGCVLSLYMLLLNWQLTECYGKWCLVTKLIALLLHVMTSYLDNQSPRLWQFPEIRRIVYLILLSLIRTWRVLMKKTPQKTITNMESDNSI